MSCPLYHRLLVLISVMLLCTAGAGAANEQVLYSFTGPGGGDPSSGVLLGGPTILYGVAGIGGTHASGTVYRLSRSGSAWTETVLYDFSGGGDGANPGGDLVRDSDGNLYGTTSSGGAVGSCSCGVVFKLSRSSSGWIETVLYAFTGGADGQHPSGGVILDSAGNLYGTTWFSNNGTAGGTVFELSPSNGSYVEHTLATLDVAYLNPNLVFDKAGNLYGTTRYGGARGLGMVYQLSPASGSWTLAVLHSFQGRAHGDGAQPRSGVIVDGHGNLYGTTVAPFGTVYELSHVNGSWQETVLYTFSGPDGANPEAPLLRDSAGNLYGTTAGGGVAGPSGNLHVGTVFELSPSSTGYVHTTLHTFSGTDGSFPSAKLSRDDAGNLYGTAHGGSGAGGVVFEITP